MFNNKPPKLPPRGTTPTSPERPSQPNPGNILNREVPAPTQGAVLVREYSKPKDSSNNDQSPPYTYTEPYNSKQGSSGNNSDNKRHGRYFGNDFSVITEAQVSPFSNKGSDRDSNNNYKSDRHLGASRGGRY